MDALPCPGCSQREYENDQLKKRVAALEAQVTELLARLDERERAGKRQASPFAKGPPKNRSQKPGRKAGHQHGPHAHRPAPAPESIDEILEAPLPEACPHCGGPLREDDDCDEQFQTDIPTRPVRRKFRIHKGTCQGCGRRIRGRHPLQTSDATGAAQSQLGPNAQASIVYLNKRSGLSYGKIADFFHEANGIDLRPSTATRIVLRAAGKLRPTYDEIKASIKDSEVITPDETGWRLGGRPVWLHAWVGEQATCYVIDPQRSADALEQVIGLDYSGTLVHDGFASYDRFLEALHQGCVAHALRRAHNLEERQIGRARSFARQVIDLLQEALAVRDDVAAGRRTLADPCAVYEDYCDRLRALTKRPRANAVNDTFARHLYNYSHAWFVFLMDPSVPATNHQAEQALRTPIVNRKVFGGNRTGAGCRAQEIASSTIQTCKQQKRSAFAFLRDAVCGLVETIFRTASSPPLPAPA
jgi:transposase